jgi:dCTP deaminase
MGTLTKGELLARLKNDLVVAPLLDETEQVSEGSINVRLGTKFIATKVREYSLLDPADLSLDRIKAFQERIQLSFGNQYVLHPRRLVLAVTFELIALPLDLCGYVLSRSRYGRAGLMVATATYIQPGWKGCLTLEMFNYGDAPIKLYCGTQIAQLVVQNAEAGLTKDDIRKRPIPMEPQFTRMDKDADWPRLKGFEGFAGGSIP